MSSKRKAQDSVDSASKVQKTDQTTSNNNNANAEDEDKTEIVDDPDVKNAIPVEFTVSLVEESPWFFHGNFSQTKRVDLVPGEKTLLGRGKRLRLKDKRLAKDQVEIVQPKSTDDYCINGANPSTIKRDGVSKRIVLSPGKDYVIHKNDELSLLVTLYNFTVKVKRKKPATSGKNYLFYSNQIPSDPNGDLVDNIHTKWFADYDLLERHHGYIQWLFPLFEGNGMNFRSKRLKKDEAKLMREDINIANRIIKSYRLMLNFYGMELEDDVTGKIKRAANWKDRYENLNESSHNNLRITRILTSLGHLGFSRWKKPFVAFLTDEIMNKNQLQNCKRALINFWQPTLKVESKQYVIDRSVVTCRFKLKTLEEASDRTDSVYFSTKK